jgi:hypothetical protein
MGTRTLPDLRVEAVCRQRRTLGVRHRIERGHRRRIRLFGGAGHDYSCRRHGRQSYRWALYVQDVVKFLDYMQECAVRCKILTRLIMVRSSRGSLKEQEPNAMRRREGQ